MFYLNYEEQRKHGTDAFPLEYYLVDKQHPRYSMPYHWHSETELLCILKGEFTISLDGEEIHMTKGDVCYIPSGMIHGGEGVDCIYECIDFDAARLLQEPPLVRRYLHKLEREAIQIQNLYNREQVGILKCTSRMLAAARKKEKGWEMLVLAGLYDFFGTVIQNEYFESAKEEKGRRDNVRRIHAVLEYIAQNYERAITLQELADTAVLSKQYFCRYFRMVTGKTPIAYLNYYRIERACLLMGNKKLTITEVALECGFNDINYFTRCFKKQKGVSPREYGKKL